MKGYRCFSLGAAIEVFHRFEGVFKKEDLDKEEFFHLYSRGKENVIFAIIPNWKTWCIIPYLV